MLPIVCVPESITEVMSNHRDVFCRDQGFEHVSRYITGLITCLNKTLQGIYDWQIWQGHPPSRRAMHEAIFESGWDLDKLMVSHRKQVAADYQGKGRHVISLDWTASHHDQGPEIYGVKKSYDYVEKRTSRFQTVVTATVSNSSRVDGLETVVQQPKWEEEEASYLKATQKESYEQMEAARQRLLELLHHHKHQMEYLKRTEIAVDIVKQVESENQFPDAHYAFDNGVLTLELTRFIESCGKHWVSEIECSRHIQWRGEWKRTDEIDQLLRDDSPQTFRPIDVRCRNGGVKSFWVFTKVVRLKRYGRKRLVKYLDRFNSIFSLDVEPVFLRLTPHKGSTSGRSDYGNNFVLLLIVHEKEDLTDSPRFLLTDAHHWESRRILNTWSYRWASEVFHEFTKQVTGLESAQVRKEEAVKRHFCLSCVAQSVIQQVPASGLKSERFSFAKGEITIGQRCRTITRAVLESVIQYVKHLLATGKDSHQILEILIPT